MSLNIHQGTYTWSYGKSFEGIDGHGQRVNRAKELNNPARIIVEQRMLYRRNYGN